MAPTTASGPVVRPAPTLYRLSVAQYQDMIRVGVLREDEKVELLEGLLVEKMTRNPPHDTALMLVQAALNAQLPSGWLTRIQCAVTSADSVPEPDVAVVLGPPRRYLRAHPSPADIALVVEISDTSLDFDRTDKLRIYARARIPVYWIVNLPDRCVEVYTQPRGGRSPLPPPSRLPARRGGPPGARRAGCRRDPRPRPVALTVRPGTRR
jgi:Uma2 family endonuclease